MPITIGETIQQLHRALQDYVEAAYHISHPMLVEQRQQLLKKTWCYSPTSISGEHAPLQNRYGVSRSGPRRPCAGSLRGCLKGGERSGSPYSRSAVPTPSYLYEALACRWPELGCHDRHRFWQKQSASCYPYLESSRARQSVTVRTSGLPPLCERWCFTR